MIENNDQPTKQQHYHGLEKWVGYYKTMRRVGNVKDAKQLRDQIKTVIDREQLDANQVWGPDPD